VWSTWEAVGRPGDSIVNPAGRPSACRIAATSWAPGRLDVVVAVGGYPDDEYPSNGIVHLSYDDTGPEPAGSWGMWTDVCVDPSVLHPAGGFGGGVHSLSLASWGPGRLDCIFQIAQDNGPKDGPRYHAWYDGSWHQPVEILGNGGSIVGAGGLVSQGPGSLDYFAANASGKVFDLSQGWFDPGSGWHGMQSIGEFIEPSAIAATSWAAGRIDVFDSYGTHRWFDRRWASGDDPMNLPHLRGELAATSWGPGRIDLVNKGPGSSVAWRSFGAGKWTGWRDLPAFYDPSTGSQTLGRGLAIASWGPGRLDAFAGDRNGRLVHIWYQEEG